MKKLVKYSLYGLIYVIVIFFLAVMFIVTAKADLVKPNNEIKPYQVVKIQLKGLMNNDIPNKNSGIEVIILGNDKNYYKFQWIVEKYYNDGALKDCWLTTSVSSPVSLGSSI